MGFGDFLAVFEDLSPRAGAYLRGWSPCEEYSAAMEYVLGGPQEAKGDHGLSHTGGTQEAKGDHSLSQTSKYSPPAQGPTDA